MCSHQFAQLLSADPIEMLKGTQSCSSTHLLKEMGWIVQYNCVQHKSLKVLEQG
jgi:hypothetical protein